MPDNTLNKIKSLSEEHPILTNTVQNVLSNQLQKKDPALYNKLKTAKTAYNTYNTGKKAYDTYQSFKKPVSEAAPPIETTSPLEYIQNKYPFELQIGKSLAKRKLNQYPEISSRLNSAQNAYTTYKAMQENNPDNSLLTKGKDVSKVIKENFPQDINLLMDKLKNSPLNMKYPQVMTALSDYIDKQKKKNPNISNSDLFAKIDPEAAWRILGSSLMSQKNLPEEIKKSPEKNVSPEEMIQSIKSTHIQNIKNKIKKAMPWAKKKEQTTAEEMEKAFLAYPNVNRVIAETMSTHSDFLNSAKNILPKPEYKHLQNISNKGLSYIHDVLIQPGITNTLVDNAAGKMLLPFVAKLGTSKTVNAAFNTLLTQAATVKGIPFTKLGTLPAYVLVSLAMEGMYPGKPEYLKNLREVTTKLYSDKGKYDTLNPEEKIVVDSTVLAKYLGNMSSGLIWQTPYLLGQYPNRLYQSIKGNKDVKRPELPAAQFTRSLGGLLRNVGGKTLGLLPEPPEGYSTDEEEYTLPPANVAKGKKRLQLLENLRRNKLKQGVR